MSIFRKQPDEQPKYGSDDLRRGFEAALQRTRQVGVHSVVCQRIIHAVADSEAVRRATSEAVI
jgi:hypothetical protein